MLTFNQSGVRRETSESGRLRLLETLRMKSWEPSVLPEEREKKRDWESVSVKIPEALAARIRKRLPGSRFSTVDEYLTFIAEQVLSEVGEKERATESPFSKEDQASVERKLRELGYI